MGRAGLGPPPTLVLAPRLGSASSAAEGGRAQVTALGRGARRGRARPQRGCAVTLPPPPPPPGVLHKPGAAGSRPGPGRWQRSPPGPLPPHPEPRCASAPAAGDAGRGGTGGDGEQAGRQEPTYALALGKPMERRMSRDEPCLMVPARCCRFLRGMTLLYSSSLAAMACGGGLPGWAITRPSPPGPARGAAPEPGSQRIARPPARPARDPRGAISEWSRQTSEAHVGRGGPLPCLCPRPAPLLKRPREGARRSRRG